MLQLKERRENNNIIKDNCMNLLEKFKSIFAALKSIFKSSKAEVECREIEDKLSCIIHDNKKYLESLIGSNKTIFEESANLRHGQSEIETLKNFLLGQDPVEQALPKSALTIKNNRCEAEWVTEAFEAIEKLFLLYRGAIEVFNDAYNRSEIKYSNLYESISNCEDEEDKLELLRDEIRRYMLAVRELRVVKNIYNKMIECTNYDQLKLQVFNLERLLQEFDAKVSKE